MTTKILVVPAARGSCGKPRSNILGSLSGRLVILASLSQIYQESVAKVRTMQPSEETGNEEDDVDEDEIAAAEAQSSKKEKVGKKAYTSSWAKIYTPWERPS